MISILIPVYNYSVKDLLNHLNNEIQFLKAHIEVIVLDDCSTNKLTLKSNKLVCENNDKYTYLNNSKNIGRTETRQLLAKKAQYEWLLFLDADVLPKSLTFISNYLTLISEQKFDACFGGFTYQETPPNYNKILRWKYGRIKESVNSTIRNKNPYEIIISANLLIQKKLFIKINKKLVGNHYGYDNIFSLQLKKYQNKVIHIDNAVFHLGLELNKDYLKKKEQAAETIYMLYSKNEISAGDNGLLKAYEFISKLRINNIITFIFIKLKSLLQKNILSTKPSIYVLDFYRLGYFCLLNKENL